MPDSSPTEPGERQPVSEQTGIDDCPNGDILITVHSREEMWSS